uniref:Peptidase A1 domain-containing protein n=1 Tax=Ditylenchus dipsaci TaxID=166011 RepID=A0A915DD67_9BILA
MKPCSCALFKEWPRQWDNRLKETDRKALLYIENCSAHTPNVALPFSYEVSCDPAFEQFLINATGAVFNSLTSSYNVNCDAVNGSPVTLNIGEEGNAKVVLTGADYIKYNKYYDVCYLAVVSKPSYAGSLYLGNNFFKNHCFTFNVNDKTIAFSKSKTPTT